MHRSKLETKKQRCIESSFPPSEKMDAPASAGFSGAIKIGDISDFIAPAQACVVGLGAAPSGAPKLEDDESVDDGSGGGGVRAAGRPSALAARAAAAVSGTAPVPKPAGTEKNGAPVKVTLNDCLACSGCVTSAETVLLEAQSAAELDGALERGDAVVVTLSQQSVASLALGGRLPRTAATLSPSEAAAALSGALRALGVAAVVDAGEPRALALLTSAAEFCAVYAASPEGRAALRRFAPRAAGGDPRVEGGGEAAAASGAGEAAALAAASAAAAAATALGVDVSAASSRLLPCLASACPGWVCYAEKNAAAAALPHAASAASAQAMAGLLIKRALLSEGGGGRRGRGGRGGRGGEGEAGGGGGGGGGGAGRRRVFHVAVMPCADKKLESLRDDLVVRPGPEREGEGGEGEGEEEGRGARERLAPPPGTDCVLTTIELSAWLSSKGFPDLASAPRSPLDSLTMMLQGGGLAACRAAAAATASPKTPLAPSAGTSGGFGEFVFRHAASTLFGVDDLPPGPLPWRAGRNGDVREISLEMVAPGKRRRQEGGGEEEQEGSGTVVLRASLHYGFRNIQTLVTKIKAGSSHSLPHFVEVMACPSGCVNGGGQLRGVAAAPAATAAGGGGGGAETPAPPPPDGRALAASVYSSLAGELRPEGSDWYASTLSAARALAGVAWPRGRVEPLGALTARVRDRKAEAAAAAAAAAAEASAGAATTAAAPAPMSVDW